MSSIEERLVRDICGRDERCRRDRKRPVGCPKMQWTNALTASRGRDRRRTVAVVAAAAVVVAGVGIGAFQALSDDDATVTPASGGEPAADAYADFLVGEAPTPENVNGFWRVDNGTIMVRFQTDGTVQFSDQGAVISDPVTIGTYTIDGDTIAVTARGAHLGASARSSPCALHSQNLELRQRRPVRSSVRHLRTGGDNDCPGARAADRRGSSQSLANSDAARLAAGDHREGPLSATGWPKAAVTSSRCSERDLLRRWTTQLTWSTTAAGDSVGQGWSSSAGRSRRSATRETCSSSATCETANARHNPASRDRGPRTPAGAVGRQTSWIRIPDASPSNASG